VRIVPSRCFAAQNRRASCLRNIKVPTGGGLPVGTSHCPPTTLQLVVNGRLSERG